MIRFVRAKRVEHAIDEENVLSQCLLELRGHRSEAIQGPCFQASLDRFRRYQKRLPVGPNLPHDFE